MNQGFTKSLTERHQQLIFLSHYSNLQKPKSFYFTEKGIKMNAKYPPVLKGRVNIRRPSQRMAFYMWLSRIYRLFKASTLYNNK